LAEMLRAGNARTHPMPAPNLKRRPHFPGHRTAEEPTKASTVSGIEARDVRHPAGQGRTGVPVTGATLVARAAAHAIVQYRREQIVLVPGNINPLVEHNPAQSLAHGLRHQPRLTGIHDDAIFPNDGGNLNAEALGRAAERFRPQECKVMA
jgi:hypothetical protein